MNRYNCEEGCGGVFCDDCPSDQSAVSTTSATDIDDSPSDTTSAIVDQDDDSSESDNSTSEVSATDVAEESACNAHSDCPYDLPFCYDGECDVCEQCEFCDDGIDGTCGPVCVYPTKETGPCTSSDYD
eukprot:UN03590